MNNRFKAAFAAVCISLALAGCSFDSLINGIKATLTKADEVILANQEVFIDACNAGQVFHNQFRAQVDAGVIKVSAKDQASEQALYDRGLGICAKVPDDLESLLAKIPSIQAWLNQLAAFKKKVS